MRYFLGLACFFVISCWLLGSLLLATGCVSVCATSWSTTAGESEELGASGEVTIGGEIGADRCK